MTAPVAAPAAVAASQPAATPGPPPGMAISPRPVKRPPTPPIAAPIPAPLPASSAVFVLSSRGWRSSALFETMVIRSAETPHLQAHLPQILPNHNCHRAQPLLASFCFLMY